MSYGASIYSHVYKPPIRAKGLCGISRGQGWRPGTLVKSAPSQLEIETQLVVDRLFRECFKRKSQRGLALLWQIAAVWASLRWRSKNEIDDGVAYGRQAWLRRRSVDSFFSAPLARGDGVARKRRRSWSSARDDEDLARIAPQSDQARAPLSTADAPVRKSIVP